MMRFEKQSEWELVKVDGKNGIETPDNEEFVCEDADFAREVHNKLVAQYNELLEERNKLLKIVAPLYESWNDVYDMHNLVIKGE